MNFHPADVLEAHALRLDDPIARELVDRWRRAALELALFIEGRRNQHVDLVDASTLAGMFVEVMESRHESR